MVWYATLHCSIEDNYAVINDSGLKYPPVEGALPKLFDYEFQAEKFAEDLNEEEKEKLPQQKFTDEPKISQNCLNPNEILLSMYKSNLKIKCSELLVKYNYDKIYNDRAMFFITELKEIDIKDVDALEKLNDLSEGICLFIATKSK